MTIPNLPTEGQVVGIPRKITGFAVSRDVRWVSAKPKSFLQFKITIEMTDERSSSPILRKTTSETQTRIEAATF